jgi:hypothetical protein
MFGMSNVDPCGRYDEGMLAAGHLFKIKYSSFVNPPRQPEIRIRSGAGGKKTQGFVARCAGAKKGKGFVDSNSHEAGLALTLPSVSASPPRALR